MRHSGIVLAGILALAPVGRAELPKNERNAAKEMLSGALYLRIDAPCRYGRQPFGVYVDALVEVTPTGSNIGEDSAESTLWTAGGVYWGFGPNDPVKLNKVSYTKDGKIEIWMVGTGTKKDYELGVRFANINSIGDFKKAFDITFAPTPLQDERSDWSPEIKKAIAEKRLTDGMTKRQAFAVVGKPLKIQVGQESGKETETWSTRQTNGLLIGYWTARGGEQTGFPVTLKFVEGALTGVGSAMKPAELNLGK
jgi:hypothetical protein